MNDCYKLVLPLKGGLKTSFFIPLVKIKSTMQNKENKQPNPHQTNNEKSRLNINMFLLQILINLFNKKKQ